MALGLPAPLYDLDAIARVPAACSDHLTAQTVKASAKAAGLVVYATVVTPRLGRQFSAKSELSIISRIALGSLRSTLLLILFTALIVSEILFWLIAPILMFEGAYLC